MENENFPLWWYTEQKLYTQQYGDFFSLLLLLLNNRLENVFAFETLIIFYGKYYFSSENKKQKIVHCVLFCTRAHYTKVIVNCATGEREGDGLVLTIVYSFLLFRIQFSVLGKNDSTFNSQHMETETEKEEEMQREREKNRRREG